MSEVFIVDIRSDIKDLTDKLTRIQKKQIPFASALAVTRTAEDVRTDLYSNMLKIFDAPVSYTVPKNIKEPKNKGSLYLIPADKKQKRFEAEVFVKNISMGKGTPALNYLNPHIEGGQRRAKGAEVSLRSKGLRGGRFITPSTRSPYGHVSLNRSGNVTKGMMNKVLSGLHSLRGMPSNWESKQKSTYFAMPKKGGDGYSGIWKREGANKPRKKGKRGKLTKLFNIVDTPIYKRRFHFYRIAEASAVKHFRRNFEKSLSHALATAR